MNYLIICETVQHCAWENGEMGGFDGIPGPGGSVPGPLPFLVVSFPVISNNLGLLPYILVLIFTNLFHIQFSKK